MKKTILLVMKDDVTAGEITSFTAKTDEFEVVATVKNGADGISVAERLNPDFVITDLVLPMCDGINVLDVVKRNNANVKVVIISSFSSDDWSSEAMQKGAAYFMVKPVDPKILIERISELSKTTSAPEEVARKSSLEEKISKIFINVGIPPHIKGYSYLREGVKMAVDDPQVINSITKKLYPSIGEKFNTSASKVERAIRHAIEVAWNRGRIETINGLFGVRAYVGAEKPTNGEFIALVADKMLLEKM